MLRNYFKITWRNLSQNIGYSFITIIGLALGLSVVLLIGLYIANQLDYDRFNQKADRIYRINSDISFSKQGLQTATAPSPMGPTLQRDFPEVEVAVRLGRSKSVLVKSQQVSSREPAVLLADSTLFDVFTLPLLAGNPKSALVQPHSVVLTERMAKKYFGTTNVLGKILVFNNEETKRITAVVRDLPTQSHFQADFILPLWETKNAKANKWGNHIFNTYLLLRPETKPEGVEAKFESILKTYLDPALRQFFNTTLAQTRKQGNYFRYSLMPLTAVHLYSDRADELAQNGHIEYIYLFSGIALFILLIAIVNFVNLTTARSVNRVREIGIRKVLGSNRVGLLAQFLVEAVLLAYIASLIGFGMALGLLPSFNKLAAEHLSTTQFLTVPTILGLLAATTIVGLVAGVYPAFYLSSFQAATALKGKAGSLSKETSLRSGLVVFQFVMSLLLIISTLIINQQVRFIQTKHPGFTKEQVVTLKTPQASENELRTLKQEILRNSGIKAATISGFLPITSARNGDYWYPAGQTDQKYSVAMQEWKVDEDYLSTFGMKLLQGRNFIKGRTTDRGSVIINERMAKRLGYPQPIGQTIHKQGGEQLRIIGVVNDFHFESLRTTIEPLGLMLNGGLVPGDNRDALSLRLEKGKALSVLAALEKTWKQVVPDQPFDYSFLNEDFAATYRTEQRTEYLFRAFTMLAIFIACLGLFGLSAFTAQQRQKEIGVRKVLGATVSEVVALLSSDFLKLVVVAILIASPLAWYAMNRWLQAFAYRIEIEWWVFVEGGLMTVAIALLTVSFQSIKAALVNPVRSLRSE